MNQTNIWHSGYCRVPNAVHKMLPPKKKAIVMGTYLWVVQNACRQDIRYADGLTLKRGQVRLTYKRMVDELGMTTWEARESLSALENAGVVSCADTRVGRTHVRVVTVCEYDSYNGRTPAVEAMPTAEFRSSNETTVRSSSHRSLKDGEERKEETTTTFSSSPSSPYSSCATSSAVSCVTAERDTDTEHSTNGRIGVGRLAQWMLAQHDWRESYEQNHSLSKEQMESWVRAFVVHLQNTGVAEKTALDAFYHFSYWHAKRRESMVRERKEADAAKERERQLYDERRLAAQRERERQQREQEETKERHLREMREAARGGDEYARKILEKYGIEV